MRQTEIFLVLLLALTSFVAARRYDVDGAVDGTYTTNTHHGHGPAGPITTLTTVAPLSTDTSVTTSSITITTPSGATTASTVVPPQSTSSSFPPISGSGWCIDFTTAPGTPEWYWTNSNPWSGTGDSSAASQCFAANDSAGGAMYIGSFPNPGPNNTKLECFFPTSGSGNCDISLVDGYSLSVNCSLPNAASIGLTPAQNLWNSNIACPGIVQDGYCSNPNGYDSAITDVGTFFQPAIDTCYIWQLDGLDPEFAGPTSISCTVSGSAPPSSYGKRGESVDVEIDAVGDARVVQRQARRNRTHARRS